MGPILQAATLTWDTGAGDGGTITGGSGTWTDGLGNWNTGSGDTTWNSATPDAAIFGGTAGTVTLGGAVTVGNMVFNSVYTVAGGGNTLTLSNSTITANTAVTISAVLGGSTGLIKDGAGALTLSGTNTYTGGTTISSGTVQVGDGGTTGQLGSGAISNSGSIVVNRTDSSASIGGVISGTGTLTQAGGGRLFLNSANSYTGATIITGGSLFTATLANGGSNSNIGASTNAAANLVLDGGKLQYGGANISTDRLFSVGTGGGTFDLSSTINFTNTGSMGFNGQSGARTLTFGINVAGTTTLAAIVGDSGGATSLTKTGTGTLALTGQNTYSGTTTISAGTLLIGSGGALGTGNIVDNGTLILANVIGPTLSQTISGTGGISINAGSPTLSGTNTYTGVTTIAGGANLLVSTIGDGGVASNLGAASNAAGNIVLGGNGALNYVGTGSVTNTDRLFSVGVTGGILASQGTGAINFTNTGSMGFNSFSGTRTLTLTGTNTGNNSLAAAIGDNGGATSLTKSGASKWILTGTNTYSGTTTISSGILQVGNGGTSGTLGTGGVTDNSSLVINRSDTLTLSNAISGTGTFTQAGTGTTILTGANSYTGATTISAGVLQIGNGGTTGTLGTNTVNNNANLSFNRSDAITVSNSINGSGGVSQIGTGTTTLTAVDSYMGVTTVSAGTLSISIFNGGGTSSNIGAASNAAANIVLNGGTLKYTGAAINTDRLFSVGTSGGALESSGSGALNLTNTGSMGFNGQSGTRTLTLTGTNTGSNTLAAVIGDNGGATALTKAGAGAWTLSGSNSYTGVTTINGGVLNVTSLANGGSNSNIGASSNAASNLVLNGGTLQYNNATTTSTDRLFSVGAAGGTISLPVAATLNFTNTGSIGFNGQTGARTLTFAFSNSTFGGIISLASSIGDNGGATSVVKSNTFGTLRLTSDNNTYTGTTTINGGAVSIGTVGGSTGSIGTGNIIINAGGTLFASRSGSVNLAQTISGAGGVTSNGNTMLTLSGTNTYTGVTRIISNGGIVTVSNLGNGGVASSIGASSSAAGNLAITNLGTLRYVGTGASTDRLFEVPTGTANPVATIESSGSGALVFTNTGAMGFGSSTGARTLVLGGTNTQNNTMNPIIGDNSGATALTKSGTGTWILGGANTYTGVTTISGGVLQVGNGGTSGTLGSGAVTDNGNLTFNRSDSLTVANAISGSGSVTQAGAGMTTLSGSNSYTGATVINAGVLNVTSLANGGSNSNLGASSNVATNLVLNGGTLRYTGGSAASIDRLFSVGTSGGTLDSSGVVLSFTNTGSMGFNGQSGARTLTLTGTNGAGNVLAAVIGDSGGATSLIKSGTGTWMLTGNNTYTGLTTISGGTLILGNFGSTGSISGDIVDNGILMLNNTAGLTLSQTISGTGGVTVNAGSHTLSGTNTYTGVTSIAGGLTLSVATLADGGVASNLGAASNSAANIVLNNGIIKYTGTGSSTDRLFGIGTLGGTLNASGTGAVNFTNTGNMGFNSQTGARTLTLTGTNTGANTLAAAIGDNGGVTSLTKSGVGTWVLTGANNYTGTTTISTGVLQVGSGGAAGTLGSGAVTDNANLTFKRSDTVTISNSISGTGSLTQAGTGTTILTGANSYAGVTTISAGTLQIGNGGTTGTLGSGTITNNGTLIIDRSNAITISGTMSGTGALIQNGTGTTTLSGLSNNWGSATVNAGVLSAGVASGLGNASAMIVNSGGTLATNGNPLGAAVGSISGSGIVQNGSSNNSGLLVSGNISSAFSGVLQDGGTGTLFLTKMGAITTLTLSGSSTYTGATSITGGTLSISTLADGGSASNIGASTNAATNLILNNPSAVLKYTGADVSTDRLFSIGSSGGTLNASGTGAVNFTNTGSMGFNSQTGARTLTLTGTNTGSNTLAAIISDNTGATSLVKSGAGTWVLSGANTYTGITTISGGVLSVSSLANGGSASNIGAASNAVTNLVLNGGTLQYTGGAVSTSRAFSLGTAAGSALDSSGSGAVNFTSVGIMGFNSQTGARTLTLTGTNTGSNTISIAIGDNGGATAITKSGAGTWLLNTFNGYTGVTTINGGVLKASTLFNGGSNSSIGAATSLSTNLVINGGTLQYTGIGSSTDRLFSVGTSGGTLDASGTGVVNFTCAGSMGFNSQSGTRTLTLTGTNTGSNTLAAVIGNNGGSTSLTKTGAGTWMLSGANTYTGATLISAGKLQAGGSYVFSNSSAVTIESGAILELNGFTNAIGTLTGSGTVQNGTSTGATLNSGGTLSTTFDGLIQNGGSAFLAFNKNGSGTLTLTGSNTYTGGTVVSNGVLSFAMLANGGVASNIGASTNAASSLILTGGTLRYTGAAVSTDRLFTVTTVGGTLDASGTGAVNFTNTGSMGFNSQSGARTLTLTGTHTGSNTIAAVIGDNGGATSLVKSGVGTWVLTGTNTYSGTTTISAGVLQIGSGSTTGTLGSGAVTNNASLVVNRSNAVTLANTISGSGTFTQAGAGTTTLSGSNSYTGVTTITAGVLKVTVLANGGSNSNIGASSNAAGNLVLNGGILQYTGTGASTNRLFSLGIGSGGIDVSGSGNLNFTNTGSMGFNGESGARTLVLSGTNTTGVNIIAAAIGDFGGATSVSIEGDATWLLTGANTYTGATTVSSGVLQIGGSNLESAIIVGAHAILELNGLNTRIGSLAGSGTVQNNSGTAATLTMSGNNTSTLFSGVIQDGGSGALALIKEGSGKFTLSGSNTYTGTTTISAGELQIGSGGTTGTLGTGAVINNASLIINRSDAITVANAISGSGIFTQAGSGTTTLTGDNSYSGSTTINAGVLSVAVLTDGGINSNLGASTNAAANLVLNGGTLQYTGGATSTDRLFSVGSSGGTLDASGTGAVNFTNTGSVDFNGQSGIRTLTLTGTNTGDNILAAIIGDNGDATALTKSGAGTWVLTGANSYTGATTISAGVLQIGNGGTTGALSTSSVLNNNGTLAFNRTDGVTQGTNFASVISGSGGVTQAGSGTLTLNGDNTYTGATNVRAGTLEVTSNNALGTGDAGTTVSSGGTLLLNNVNYSTSEALTLNGSGVDNGGALRNAGTSTYTGTITAATNATINTGGGILNLTGGLVKDGTVLTLTGGGTVNVSGTGISGASASSDLVVDGTTLVVSADSDYNGPTTVQNGAVLIANAAVTTTRLDLSSDSLLAGSGALTTAVNQSIFLNGVLSVGDPGVVATATNFALTTSGSGAVVMGADSVIQLDLFTGAGLGNNLSNSTAADSINLHGQLDATAGGTVVIGNPNGMTGFHGGDQWQLVHLNTGDANAGSFVASLALNDSSLGLASGVTSYLDQSTGVFSIIDTNGGLALAAVEGQALISAGNTVTSDLNGHLFNLRNGGGEEGSDSDSITAALDEGVIVGQGDGDPKKESPIAKRVARSRQWEVFSTVNYGNVKLSPIRTQSGVQVDSWASGIGAERHFSRGLTLGFAASFLQSTQGYTGNASSLHLEGPALSAYISYVRGNFWNSLLYSFGTYQMDSVRHPGAPFPTAFGSTRTYTHSVQYNTGWNFRFQNDTLVTGPFIGVDYLHGTVNAYSETGGGLAALRYSAQSYQSLVSRVGWSASKQMKTRFATITPQVRLSYERQNIRNNNGTSVSLINVPFSSVGGGQTPGQDYLVAGLGMSIAFTDRFSLMLSYQGQFFRHDLQAHFGSVRFSYQY
ncbi:MAG: autotransporter-associated beta strand repeat-containing protein [Prosthecobacter sp.]|nr:autotransporter-associated beta strand repeat-containing protein [Prosthecobacter sp.]